MSNFFWKGLDQPSERRSLIAVLMLLTIYLLAIAGLLLASVPVDKAFYQSREAFDVDHLPQLIRSRLPDGKPAAVSEGGRLAGFIVLINGWSIPEPWGVWTDGHKAEFAVGLPKHYTMPVTLGIWANIMAPKGLSQRIRIMSSNAFIAQWESVDPTSLLCARIPASLIGNSGVLRLTFEISHPVQAPGGSDDRELGLGLKQIAVFDSTVECQQESAKQVH